MPATVSKRWLPSWATTVPVVSASPRQRIARRRPIAAIQGGQALDDAEQRQPGTDPI